MNVFDRQVGSLVIVILALVFTGCGTKKDAVVTDPDALPEVVAVQHAFAAAPPSFRNPVNQTLELVKAGKVNRDAYSEALPQLQMLATNPNITADQKRVLEALTERLKAELHPKK